jgi:hypothetical protein
MALLEIFQGGEKKKRFIFPIVLFAIAVFVLPAYADPPVKQVEVVNAPDNAVPVVGNVEVTNTVDAQVTDTVDVNVTNTTTNSVPVTVTNPATCSATINGIARQDGAATNPTADLEVDLITLSGPGTFVSARFIVSGGTESDRRNTLLVLEIDGNAIVQDTFTDLNAKGSNKFNFFGIVADMPSGIAVTVGFPLPVSFQSSLVLSATPPTASSVSALEAAVIYGE